VAVIVPNSPVSLIHKARRKIDRIRIAAGRGVPIHQSPQVPEDQRNAFAILQLAEQREGGPLPTG
jgi:hypothetical protein